MKLVTYRSGRDRLPVAADWWTRLRHPLPAVDTTQMWLEWIDEDPHNLEAFEQVNAYAQTLSTRDAFYRERLLREFARPAAPAWRRPLLFAAAAAALLTFGAGYLALRHPVAPEPLTYSTAAAQNRDFVLPDNSRVTLGAASTMRVDFNGSERRVELVAGEAYFEVQHDALRRFVVGVADVTVRAIGTAFDVRRTGQRVSIDVTHGRVRIFAGAATGANPAVEAGAGQRVTWDPQVAALRVSAVTPEQATGWREQRLEFIDEPLGVVIANVNRYRTQSVSIDGKGLAALSFSGTVNLGATDSWLRALPQVFPVRVVEQGQRTVVVPR